MKSIKAATYPVMPLKVFEEYREHLMTLETHKIEVLGSFIAYLRRPCRLDAKALRNLNKNARPNKRACPVKKPS